MKIEAAILKENEDGSADVSIEMDDEGKKFLIAYGFEHSLKEALKNMEVAMLDNEDQAWEEHKQMHDVHERNKASMAAWCAAGVYITDNADKLARITIRQAYEQGFLDGYKKKGEDNGKN